MTLFSFVTRLSFLTSLLLVTLLSFVNSGELTKFGLFVLVGLNAGLNVFV